MSEAVEEHEQQEWTEVRDSLQETDTDSVANQLDFMRYAEVVYSDGETSDWYTDIVERYEELVEGFGGEESVDQYMEIGAKGVSIAVEHDDEHIFTVYAAESGYSSSEAPKTDIDTAV